MFVVHLVVLGWTTLPVILMFSVSFLWIVSRVGFQMRNFLHANFNLLQERKKQRLVSLLLWEILQTLGLTSLSRVGSYRASHNRAEESYNLFCCLCPLDQPTGTALTPTPTNTTVLRGSTVLLNCSTDANPAAHMYQLYVDDTVIGNSSDGLFNITVNADGAYTCVPINKVDTGSNVTVNFTVVGKKTMDYVNFSVSYLNLLPLFSS